MHISLCVRHLTKVPNTNPKTVWTSKFIGLGILPFQPATGDLFLETPSFES